MTYTKDFVLGALSKTEYPVIKSAVPDVADTVFTPGQLVAITGQELEDWLKVAAISTAVTPVSKCVIVTNNELYAPKSYQVVLSGVVAVPIASGTTMTAALLYDWTNKRFTTTSSASTFDVSSRLRIEQIAGLKASVQFI